jgi:hypothetical protein
MKKLKQLIIITTSILLLPQCVIGQSYDDKKKNLANFISRMFNSQPFEGVKIIEDFGDEYLISALTLDKAKFKDLTTMNRVAQVKSQSQASTFLNGAEITMEFVITTTDKKIEEKQIDSITETIEKINQNSTGFCQGLELLTNFENTDGSKMNYIYIGKLNK